MTGHPHVNETSTGGYLPRERIPGETYRGTFAEPDELPEITMEQIEQAVAVVLERFEIEPLVAGDLIGAVIEARDTDGRLVDVVGQAAAARGYPDLDVAAFCQVVDGLLGDQNTAREVQRDA